MSSPNPPLAWNRYCWHDGLWHCAEQPPVCTHPGCVQGNVVIVPYNEATGALALGDYCPACHGSGTAPHWHIQPTDWLDGLVCVTKTGQWKRVLDIGHADRLFSIGWGESVSWDDCTPLAPPPSAGCTLPQALSLLPGACVNTPCHSANIQLGDGCFTQMYERRAIFQCGMRWPCTVPLRLALQRHDAIQQYIAGWQKEGM